MVGLMLILLGNEMKKKILCLILCLVMNQALSDSGPGNLKVGGVYLGMSERQASEVFYPVRALMCFM